MAFDEFLADRIRQTLIEKESSFVEKKMMGGLCFMVNDKMCVGIIKNSLMARVGEMVYQDCLKKDFCKEMDFTGKPLKGFVMIEPEGVDLDQDLEYWIQLCLDYNPLAKSSKKK